MSRKKRLSWRCVESGECGFCHRNEGAVLVRCSPPRMNESRKPWNVFRNPFTSLTKESTGVIPNKDSQAVKASEGNFDAASMIELNMLRKLAQDLARSLVNNSEDPEQAPAKLDLLPEGIRISVFDRAKRPVFEAGSANSLLTGVGLQAPYLAGLPLHQTPFRWNSRVNGKGHPHFRRTSELGNIPDRANIAAACSGTRRQDEQVRNVAGIADTQPMDDRLIGTKPTDAVPSPADSKR